MGEVAVGVLTDQSTDLFWSQEGIDGCILRYLVLFVLVVVQTRSFPDASHFMAITKREKVSNSNGSRVEAKGKQRAIESDEEMSESAAGKEDGEEDAEGEDEEGEEPVHSTKRQRINDMGDSRASTHEAERIPIVKTLPRDTDGCAHITHIPQTIPSLT